MSGVAVAWWNGRSQSKASLHRNFTPAQESVERATGIEPVSYWLGKPGHYHYAKPAQKSQDCNTGPPPHSDSRDLDLIQSSHRAGGVVFAWGCPPLLASRYARAATARSRRSAPASLTRAEAEGPTRAGGGGAPPATKKC